MFIFGLLHTATYLKTVQVRKILQGWGEQTQMVKSFHVYQPQKFPFAVSKQLVGSNETNPFLPLPRVLCFTFLSGVWLC